MNDNKEEKKRIHKAVHEKSSAKNVVHEKLSRILYASVDLTSTERTLTFSFCSCSCSCLVHGENYLDILLFIVHADVQNKLIIIMLYVVKLCLTCGS